MLLAENKNLAAPSMCIICETVPDGPSVVDTRYTLVTGTFSPYEGHKFVCERCVATMAKLFGFERGDEVEKAIIDKDFAERQFKRLVATVKEFAEQIASAVEAPGVVDEVKPEGFSDGGDKPIEKPKPKPKPKPKKVEVTIEGDASKVKEDK